MNALIVIPVFDEAATVGAVVGAASRYASVLVVDDGSRDGSAAAARRAGAEVLSHPRRLGKGQAIQTGIAAARRRGASAIVTLDGDGQHDPSDLPEVLEAARSAPRTIVVGGREARLLPLERLNAIRVAGFFVDWASGLALRDTQSGFRVYPVALFDEIDARHGGFVFETEVLVVAALRGWQVREVPVTTIPRAGRPSRFRPIGDGAAIGAYLAGRVAARWAREARTAGRALVSPFLPAARRTRHAAILQEIAPQLGAPGAWALALAGAHVQRVSATLAEWWEHPRRRRAALAAGATLAAPAVVALLLVQALAGRRLPDFVSPVVNLLCSRERLSAPSGRPLVMALVAPTEPRR